MALWERDWVHYNENEELKLNKETLPISIQKIIEWAAKLYGEDTVIDLDFDEIDKDLQHQYTKYKEDKKSLKKLYFDYTENPYDYVYDMTVKDDYYKMNEMYFDDITMVHFLINITENNFSDNKCVKQALIMLKLLIINDIINIDHAFSASTFGITVWSEIKQLTYQLNENQYEEDVIDTLADLIIVCVNKKPLEEQEAIFMIDIDVTTNMSTTSICCRNFLDNTRMRLSFNNYPENKQLRNNHRIIEKLLLRGMLPFQINRKKVWTYNADDISSVSTDSTMPSLMSDDDPESDIIGNEADLQSNDEQYSTEQSTKIKQNDFLSGISRGFLAENRKKKGKNQQNNKIQAPKQTKTQQQQSTKQNGDKKNNNSILKLMEYLIEQIFDKHTDGFPLKKMNLLTPWILHPYLLGAKKMMIHILSPQILECKHIENETLSTEISNIISSYILDYDIFHDKDIENVINFNHLSVRSMIFIGYMVHFEMDQQFVEIFNNNYIDKLFVNYFINNYLFSISFIMQHSGGLRFDVIRTLIDIYNEDFKFPLDSSGIYSMIRAMLKQKTRHFENNYKEYIKLFKYVKKVYGKQFDINFENNQDETIVMQTLKCWKNGLKNDVAMDVIKFILSTFKDEYNINAPCLLHQSLRFRKEELFVFLIDNYEYTLDTICQVIRQVINAIDVNHYKWDSWNKYNKDKCNKLLNLIKSFCISICKNDKEIKLLNNTIDNALQKYNQKIQQIQQ